MRRFDHSSYRCGFDVSLVSYHFWAQESAGPGTSSVGSGTLEGEPLGPHGISEPSSFEGPYIIGKLPETHNFTRLSGFSFKSQPFGSGQA